MSSEMLALGVLECILAVALVKILIVIAIDYRWERIKRSNAIAEAHPKCGTCDHCHRYNNSANVAVHDCTNTKSVHCFYTVNPTTDYCPHHSELTKPDTQQENTR